MDSVALVRHKADLDKTLKIATELIGGFGELKNSVLIKPNLCTDVDTTGRATTSIPLVESLVKLILETHTNVSVRIIESDSLSKFVDEAFSQLGYTDLEKRLRNMGFDVSLVNLSREPTVKVDLDGLYFKDPELPEILTQNNYFISLAVAKTHSLTDITGSIKNLFGLLPRKGKSRYHIHIDEVIVDLSRIIKPNLCIVDAIMSQNGVLSGRTRRLDRVIVGKKPVSVDATMARIMGYHPERINHLVMAEKYNLGTLNPTIVGERIELASPRGV